MVDPGNRRAERQLRFAAKRQANFDRNGFRLANTTARDWIMVLANAAASETFRIGGDIPVNRLGFGAMRITGRGIWGPPADHAEAIRTLRRLPELGVNFIDTADSYGPDV